VLGGYWMIDVKSRRRRSLGEALPAASNEVIEIRQVQKCRISPRVQEAAAGFTELQGKPGR